MNDRNKHKVTRQMNHQTADSKANTSQNQTSHFLPTLKEHLDKNKRTFTTNA
jgi:hypothetical protein